MRKVKLRRVEAKRLYIGIDNGVTGGITALDQHGKVIPHKAMPVKNCLSYTKKKQWVNRVDVPELTLLLSGFALDYDETFCFVERPMINPGRFKATISAVRCLEATEIVLQLTEIPYQFIDSKEWQSKTLPKGIKKEEELKKAAIHVCGRLFPKVKVVNADCLLIAESCRTSRR